ncbi:MAG: 2TM domain-containing protein [Thermoleophilaceae bacterium]|nr:2TM domain-containing protein [Thermoleophilaceae bacterium]
MPDDPFSRAVQQVEAAEQAKEESRRNRRQEQFTAGNRTAFRVHATVFVGVNLLLIAIWAMTWQLNDATSYPWFVFVTLGWGIGLAAHYAAARRHLTAQAVQSQPAVSQPLAPPAPAESSTTEELARLAQLHSSGSLTDEEFSAAKAKLLR